MQSTPSLIMNKISKKTLLIAVSAALLIGFVALVIHNYKTKTSFKYNSSAPTESAVSTEVEKNPQDAVNAAVNKNAESELSELRKKSNLTKALPGDFILGDKNAPVTMIEYASISCPHCASFSRESFEKLKTEYVDSGKVQFIFRSFPLDQSALTATMFAVCQAQDNKEQMVEKYYATLKILFKTQDSWGFDVNAVDKIEAIAKLDGMSSERFKSCVNDKALQDKILNSRMEAAHSLQIRSAPSFFVNGEISEGYVDYLTLKKLIDQKLAEKNNARS